MVNRGKEGGRETVCKEIEKRAANECKYSIQSPSIRQSHVFIHPLHDIICHINALNLVVITKKSAFQ